MRKRFFGMCRLLLVLTLLTSVIACAKKTVPGQPGLCGVGGGGMGSTSGTGGATGAGLGAEDARWRELGINSEQEKREFLEKAQAFENEDIYFDFDAHTLSAPAKKILDQKVVFLKRYAKTRVSIEGHCDERGTTEYNLALGERRATSAMQYLINSGIPQTRMGTISYGKERPASTGHDEAAWAKNRRDHFVLNY